jgi:hypothetical protein
MVDFLPSQFQIVSSRSKKGVAFNYTQTILARWTVGDQLYPATIEDVRDVLAASGKQDWVNIVIGGATPYPYPGQEGQPVTWKSYTYTMNNLVQYANIPDLDTATDWMNLLLMGLGEAWDEVYTVQVVDR